MAGVVFVFVREDANEVEALADAFDAAGHAITGNENAELSVIVWSRGALRSDSFRVAAERALRSGKAVVAALFAPPPRETLFGAPVIDLSRWDGVDEAALEPLLRAADDIVDPVEAHVIVLPADPAYDVAPRAAPLLIASEDSAPAAEPKLGAPAPRRDFRRIGARRSREHAALAFLLIAMVSGGAFVVSVAANTASYVQAERVQSEEGGGVSLTSASGDAIGLEDTAPEPEAPVGRRGVEPPSAVHRAGYEP